MKTILLKGELRNGLGSSSSKALRSEGKVPCVMYGAGENLNFAIYQADFKNLIYTPNVFKVKIEVGGKTYNGILQDVQYHPVSEAILHVDFMEVKEGSAVIMEIPIRVVGNSPGVRAGGKLVKKFNKLRVRGAIGNLPDYIDVNIDTLEIGQSVKVKEISVTGFDILDAKENAIVSCKTTRALMQAEAGAPSK
ncbi:MAG: 50S ribosomal protein L25/general stress protein Ctc [Bacteroidetes bacterium]|nr:50S ribosomal protein L25/general stress protein Ctc [Bacteroidota bacterium]